MKFIISFKTPDAVSYTITELEEDGSFSEDEIAKAKDLTYEFIEYDENVSIEFDTEAGTATVLKK